jgi:hypothetical protein
VQACGGGGRTLRRWLRREGLRRSLDAGTRWVLLEVLDPFLPGRVEREVRAFLLRLFHAGFFEGSSPEAAFDVRCEASIRETSRGATALLELVVEARLRAGAAAECIGVSRRRPAG